MRGTWGQQEVAAKAPVSMAGSREPCPSRGKQERLHSFITDLFQTEG